MLVSGGRGRWPLPACLSFPLAGSEPFGTGTTGGKPDFPLSVRRGAERDGSVFRCVGVGWRRSGPPPPSAIAGREFGPALKKPRRRHEVAGHKTRCDLFAGVIGIRTGRWVVAPVRHNRIRCVADGGAEIDSPLSRFVQPPRLFRCGPPGPCSAKRQRDEGMPTLCSSMSISSASRYLTTVTLFSAAMSVWRRTFTS